MAPLLEGLAQKRALADRVETALAEPLQGKISQLTKLLKATRKVLFSLRIGKDKALL